MLKLFRPQANLRVETKSGNSISRVCKWREGLKMKAKVTGVWTRMRRRKQRGPAERGGMATKRKAVPR